MQENFVVATVSRNSYVSSSSFFFKKKCFTLVLPLSTGTSPPFLSYHDYNYYFHYYCCWYYIC